MLAYDAYIVGADTVWTPLKIHDVEAEMFYLDFAKYIYAFLFNDLPGAMEMVNELPLFASVMKVFLPRQNRWFAWY